MRKVSGIMLIKQTHCNEPFLGLDTKSLEDEAEKVKASFRT